MALQPYLVGEKLIVRGMTAADWAGLYAAASDPLIWEQHPNHDRWQEPVFRRFFDKALDSRGALTVIDRASGTIIGTSRYYDHDPAEGTVTIGYSFLARPYWGGGYNGELKQLMIEHIHQYVPIVLFQVDLENHRSQAALAKIGATPRPLDQGPEGKRIFEIRRT